MLKELFQSWFKRHEHKHEEVPMSDSAIDLAAVVPPIPSIQGMQSLAVSDPGAVIEAVPALASQQDQDGTQQLAKSDLGYVEPEGTNAIETPPLPAHLQHDAFAEKLRHVLKLAEVEIEHVWDEAVALAKKLV